MFSCILTLFYLLVKYISPTSFLPSHKHQVLRLKSKNKQLADTYR